MRVTLLPPREVHLARLWLRPDQATKMVGAVHRSKGGGRRCLGQNRSCVVVSELEKMGGSKTWRSHRLVLSPLHYRGGHRRRWPSLSPSHCCRLLVGAELRLQVLGRRRATRSVRP